MKNIIDPAAYSGYIVTGLLYNSTKRFKIKTNEIKYAFSINLWRGSVWGMKKSDNKKELLKRVFN